MHIDVIRRAYDECGIIYVVRDGDDGWQYLFLTGEYRKKECERMPIDWLCSQHSFMEFKDGKVASY